LQKDNTFARLQSPFMLAPTMKFFRFLVTFLATSGLVWLLSNPMTKGDTSVPPLGKLFNPFTGFWRNAEPLTGPVFNPNVKLPGLKGKVELLYDDNMVPHIFAENPTDAAMVQGYLTAQHRLFQMDLTARKVSGRLSEVIGERTLPIDLKTRRRGLPWAAERDLEIWKQSPEDMALIEAYCAGANAWINNLQPADYPIEFKLLGHTPEAWTPLKCVMIAEGMADILAVYDNDLEATNTLQLLGDAFYKDIYPVWNPKQKPVIPEGFYPTNPTMVPQKTSPNAVPPGLGPATGGVAPANDDVLTDPYILGSNNWAVAGSKTATGTPLLANDPHLSLSLPSIWFQVQIHTPQYNTYGVSLSGIPGVVIGFNEHIAWGITNVGVDVTDWYKIKWTSPARTHYEYDGAAKAAETRVETVLVKGRKEPVLDTVRYTVWGPVVYDDPSEPLHDCALRWAAHDAGPGKPVTNFFQLNQAKNFTEYSTALTGFDCPAQNFVFADKYGDIAIRVQGNMPIRQGDEGRFIRDGSSSAQQWIGFIPQPEIPKMHNPARGFVTSANQNSTAPSYPYHAKHGDWEQYRGRNAVEWLETMKGATLDSMKRMQNSNFSLRAYDALRPMLQLVDRSQLSTEEQAYLKELEGWNCSYDKDKIAPTLFEIWFDSTYEITYDEVLNYRKQNIKVQLPPTWRFIELMTKDTNHYVFDLKSTPERETARQMVTLGFKKMSVQAAKEALANNLVYGNFHSLTINHLARIAPFSRSNIPVSGHRSALNAVLRDYGPSWRMLVDLGSEVKGYGVYPGGQSGNPGSRFYDNMVDTWVNGQYNELNFLKTPDQLPLEKTLAKQVFSAN
jgi:penicillin G amidase